VTPAPIVMLPRMHGHMSPISRPFSQSAKRVLASCGLRPPPRTHDGDGVTSVEACACPAAAYVRSSSKASASNYRWLEFCPPQRGRCAGARSVASH